MPYRITRHSDDLLWVVLDGHLAMDQAEAYFYELWALLDTCPSPTDLLVDGRRIAGASPAARRRTEQVVHHPRLGHLAFVVSEHHLLIFAPLVKLVSGVGLFGNEVEALDYLRTARGMPPVIDLVMPNLPPPPVDTPAPPPHAAEAHGAAHHGAPPHHNGEHQHPPVYSMPSPRRPMGAPPNLFSGLTDMLDGWTNNLRNLSRQIERD